MKILFIFTGGTISTTLSNSIMEIDEKKTDELLLAYNDKFGIDFEYNYQKPYLSLSENNTGEQLDALCACVRANIDNGYDGIVITHGTDSLQYSACALAYCLKSDCIPVCLVSASYPISNPNSNALDNLHGAITIIKQKLANGVVVPFRNSKDSCVKVHLATRLLLSKAFSDEVMSKKDIEYGYFDEHFNFVKNENLTVKSDEIPPFNPCFTKTSPVLFLKAHVGMVYPDLSNKVKYVLISSYHSGTVDTESEPAINFYNKAKDMGIKIFIAGVNEGDKYKSATKFDSFSLTALSLTEISAYIKLWLIANSNLSDALISSSLAYDL